MTRLASILFAAAVLASLPACSAIPGPVATPPGSGISPFTWTPVPPAGAEAEEDACKNTLYPVEDGATWDYTISGGASGTLTRTITNVKADSFSDQLVYATGTTRSGVWQCDDGIMALQPEQIVSALVLMQKAASDLHTTDNSGVTIPDNLGPGAIWNQDTAQEGTQSVNGQDVPASVHDLMECRAGSSESITVPAGTFDALRTDCSFKKTLTLASGGAPVKTTATFSAWYAEGVGMVKAVEAVTKGLQDTLELRSFHIP